MFLACINNYTKYIMKITARFITFWSAILLLSLGACTEEEKEDISENYKDTIQKKDTVVIPPPKPDDKVRIQTGTFLGGEKRNYYGNIPPEGIDIIWKKKLGTGETRVGGKILKWSGAGWTGQPLIVTEDTSVFIIQGSYNHKLRKINAKDGKTVWEYDFNDVIKGTGTLWVNPNPDSIQNKYVILQGARQGFKNGFRQKHIPSYRAVSYMTGKELWRMNVKHTRSYSRDVDASALIIADTAYIGLENGIFTVFNPDPAKVDSLDGMIQPEIHEEHWLFSDKDALAHGGNLVTEASPARIGNHVYVSSGSGHIFGYNLDTRKIDWDFYTGSDIDGSPIVTADSCIMVAIERQYIAGKGGMIKLDPSLPADSCVKWYMPTGNRNFAGWLGGIIGSAGTNSAYIQKSDSIPEMAAFIGIDCWLYVVDVNNIEPKKKVKGPLNKHSYPTPKLIYKYKTDASISTPVFFKDKLIAASYAGIYLFEYDKELKFKMVQHNPELGSVESTPAVHNGKLYLASKNGNLYCLGKKEEKKKKKKKMK